MRSLRLMLRPASQKSNVADAPNPIPPNWIIPRMAPWPNVDQYDPVSTTTRPVTHTADVAVKRATLNGGDEPLAVETGSIRSNVPSAITPAKPSTIMSALVRTAGAAPARPRAKPAAVTGMPPGSNRLPKPNAYPSLTLNLSKG